MLRAVAIKVIFLALMLAPLASAHHEDAPTSRTEEQAYVYTGGAFPDLGNECRERYLFYRDATCFDILPGERNVSIAIRDATNEVHPLLDEHEDRFVGFLVLWDADQTTTWTYEFCDDLHVALPQGAVSALVQVGDPSGQAFCPTPPTAGTVTAVFGR